MASRSGLWMRRGEQGSYTNCEFSGTDRIQFGGVDIGAFEFAGPLSMTLLVR